MVALLVLFLFAAAVFGRLGVWQLDRAVQRGEAAAAARAEDAARQGPVPLAEVLAPQTTFTTGLVGRHVTVTGEFTGEQLVVLGRVHDGREGALILNALAVPQDGGGVAHLAVVRGWVRGPQDPAASELPPSGTVQVTGWLQVGEAAGSPAARSPEPVRSPEAADRPEAADPPESASPSAPVGVDAISPAELVNRWGGPMYTGYLVLDSMEPAQDPAVELLGPPGATSGGLNWQNLAYAVQWWLFGLFAVGLWWRIVRDAAR